MGEATTTPDNRVRSSPRLQPQNSPAASPLWRKPSEVMKIRKKKQRTASVSRTINFNSSTTPFGNVPSKKENSAGLKRRNPFGVDRLEGSSPRKRIASDSEVVFKSPKMPFKVRTDEWRAERDKKTTQEFSIGPNTTTNSAETDPLTPLTGSPNLEEDLKLLKLNMMNPQNNIGPLNAFSKETNDNDLQQDEVVMCTADSLPLDWSIKSRIRFMSPKPFTWCSKLKTMETARGVTDFTRCLPPIVIPEPQGSSRESLLQSEFVKNTHYWMHPCIPWIKLFPRSANDNPINTNDSVGFSDEQKSSLYSSWCSSFESVYHAVKVRQCPYFYLCASHYTALFIAPDVMSSNTQTTSAMITPTTVGFRDAMKIGGVSYTMPLQRVKNTTPDEPAADRSDSVAPVATCDITDTSQPTVANSKPGGSDDEIDPGESQATDWLESIGLDKESFPTLQPWKVKIQQNKQTGMNLRLESLVHVSGTNTQALFNFLLNSKTTIASSGLQDGLPPTILAPVSFRGATLLTHKVIHGTVKHFFNGEKMLLNTLELVGPILPETIQNLSTIFTATQGEFQAACSLVDQSNYFNSALKETNSSDENISQSPNPWSCGTCKELLEKSSVGDTVSGVIRDFQFHNSKYSWTV